MNIIINEKGQAVAPSTIQILEPAFDMQNHTSIYWLGNGGIMINSRGTIIMIDPLLKGFDLPLLVDVPIKLDNIPLIDGLLITHYDNDHYSKDTCIGVVDVCKSYHAPKFVANAMKEEININSIGHNINDSFLVKDVSVTLTKAWHNWQNHSSKYQYRNWEMEDYCGYLLDTKDGSIWLPGDSRLLDEHLLMEEPKVILLDFSDNDWHITLNGAITLANNYPNSDLICIHWGTVDAPTMTAFNANPLDLFDKVINPSRIKILAVGQEYMVKK